ncbi:UvrD-helicase domain-containing protein [Actinomadura adrarensis]|uniref:DNA 3'-5' helicase n=1 Tax=Actinomadura adrarensis TaxID=1819600 RepID=A0ABW3C9P5_9ACTN
MARLGIHRDFLEDLIDLERPVQRKVLSAIRKFEQATHASIHLEKLANVRDDRLKSIRIDRSVRGIVLAPESGDHFTLMKVLPHDDAYAWAARRQLSVNAASGHIEIRDSVAIETATEELAKATTVPVPERLFSHVPDEDLIRLGIDEQVRTFARLLTDIAPLEAIKGYLPGTQYDALYGLAAGLSVQELIRELDFRADGETIDPDDIARAVERTPSRITFVEGPEELMDLFEKPFALWRVYLHPTQRQVAYGSYSGPAQVTGGPGTGKTVVAVHRARHLAAQGGRVLLTTFTSTLAESLRDSLRLLESDAEVLERIDVRHVDSIAARIVRDRHGPYAILRDAEEQHQWRRVIRRRGVQYNETFLAEEWRQVVLAQDLRSLDNYLAARRRGRGRRLGPLQRTQIWHVISEFERELGDRGARTYETVCADATRILSEQSDKPYDHVIVDEAQDLHPVRWRLLRALVPPGRNDLFIVGDTHQRIYDNRVSLQVVGVHVAGRSTRLKISYRTTSEILKWSRGVLAGEEIQDLDGGTDSLRGFRSDMHGPTPELVGTATKTDELRTLTAKVRTWLNAGVEPGEIGVAARSGPLAQEAARALEQAGIPARHLSRNQGLVEDRVPTMTMHRMKGLEFRCVAVIGAGEHQLPDPRSVRSVEDDELTHAHDLQRELCTLYVACTRAREVLHISWHGDPSPFLSDLASARR